ncbi:MAG: primosomal protein N' [Clostridia bacterium]|nr:primosomal protein N' [Clostridia bacterium]
MSLIKQYAGVYILDVPYHIDKIYDYYIPAELVGEIYPGQFVMLPFGNSNRKVVGVVCELREHGQEIKAKPIFSICSSRVALSAEMLELCAFLKERTLCTFGDAVRAVVPPSSVAKTVKSYFVTDREFTPDSSLTNDILMVYEFIRSRERVREESLVMHFGERARDALRRLKTAGFVAEEATLKEGIGEKFEKIYSLAVSHEEARAVLEGKTVAAMKRKLTSEPQLCAVRTLLDGEKSEKELSELGTTAAQLKTLCDRGLLKLEKRQVFRNPYDVPVQKRKEFIPNDEQRVAIDTLTELIRDGKPHGALLYGVTGSGKTGVMMEMIDRVTAMGRGAILMLPEIALTPQLLGIFCARYGNRVAVFHSGLSAGERNDSYARVKSGKADIAIGTRSVIFAPMDNIGIIVIDEEQEHTYKSDMNPKYHARDVARFRCAKHGALMLLASATPSVESYKKAKDGVYTLVKLTKRHGSARLPEVTIHDMRTEAQTGNTTPIGGTLADQLVKTHERGEQSVLFLNRRGYNNYASCVDCGTAIKCDRCSVAMTYHTHGKAYDDGELVCHWCGRRIPMVKTCPECGGNHITRLGYGTQRVERELEILMPDARVIRLDADSTGEKFAMDDLLGRFRRGEADVMLGTQMVTKGHDFPKVTLVGVLLADMSLYLDDYRANERTFAMLTQVIGRAGRADREGHAVIQTNNPDNDIIRLACAQDYDSFYENEIRLRKLLTFPPFCDIVLTTLSHHDERELASASTLLANMLKEAVSGEFSDVPLVVFGPFEAPVFKVDGKYRMRMVIKCVLNARSREMFSTILTKYGSGSAKKPILSIDFNPTNL